MRAAVVKMRSTAVLMPPPGKQQPSGIYEEHAFLYSKQFLT